MATSTHISIIGEITSDTLVDVLKQIEQISEGDDVILNIASYGGEILSAIAIIDALKKYHTTAEVLGFACSAAAILALSCENVSMSEHASLMIHSAWAEDISSEDPGIKRCNEVQLEIIKKRCPSYTPEMLITDRWLSADECMQLGLADNININKVVNWAADSLSAKFAAKLKPLSYRRDIMAEENVMTTEELIEEVQQDEKKKEAVGEQPMVEEGSHDLIEVIEKLAEKVNELEGRLKALEEPMKEDVVVVEDDDNADRINNLYNAICKPTATLAVACTPVKASVKKVRSGFEKYTSI